MSSKNRFNVSALAEEVLRNPNPGTRKTALQGLSIYMTHERIFELIQYVSERDANAEVRATAAKLVASITPPSSDIQ